MNYIENVKKVLKEELVAVDPAWPADADGLVDLYVLLALTLGLDTNAEDVHDAWSIWRNLTIPDHKSLIPFDDLSTEVQDYDRKYQEAIVSTVTKIRTLGA